MTSKTILTEQQDGVLLDTVVTQLSISRGLMPSFS